jgi:hypothetical protein
MSSNNAQAQAREHDRAVRRAERERARRVARDEAAERKRAAITRSRTCRTRGAAFN